MGTVNRNPYSFFKANAGDNIVAQITVSSPLLTQATGVPTSQASKH